MLRAVTAIHPTRQFIPVTLNAGFAAHRRHSQERDGTAEVDPRTNPLSREGGVGAGAFLALAVSG